MRLSGLFGPERPCFLVYFPVLPVDRPYSLNRQSVLFSNLGKLKSFKILDNIKIPVVICRFAHFKILFDFQIQPVKPFGHFKPLFAKRFEGPSARRYIRFDNVNAPRLLFLFFQHGQSHLRARLNPTFSLHTLKGDNTLP